MNLKFIISDNIKDYFSNLKEKITNLPETNYQLGLDHLKNGDIMEALFRFKLTKFFWPKHYKSFYQYAYCVFLAGGIDNSTKILRKLLQKHPDYQKAKDLLKRIENGETEQLISEYQKTLVT